MFFCSDPIYDNRKGFGSISDFLTNFSWIIIVNLEKDYLLLKIQSNFRKNHHTYKGEKSNQNSDFD